MQTLVSVIQRALMEMHKRGISLPLKLSFQCGHNKHYLDFDVFSDAFLGLIGVLQLLGRQWMLLISVRMDEGGTIVASVAAGQGVAIDLVSPDASPPRSGSRQPGRRRSMNGTLGP